MKAAWLALGAFGYLALPLAFFLACLEPTTRAIRGLSDAGGPSSAAGSAGSGGASGAGGAGGAPDACERARLAGPSVGLPKLPWRCYVESDEVPGGCATCRVLLPPAETTLASVAKLAPVVGGCHAEMVRSPLAGEVGTDKRRPALVVDGVTSGGVGAARTR